MIVGADIALNHGALVTTDGQLLCYYEDGIGMMSGASDLYAIADKLARNTPAGSTVIIEWDRDMGHWRSPTVGVLMTMLAAFYGGIIQATRDCEVHYVTPALVRFCLGLEPTTSKKNMHAAICEQYKREPFMNDRHGDVMDAWILCQSWACAKEQFSL